MKEWYCKSSDELCMKAKAEAPDILFLSLTANQAARVFLISNKPFYFLHFVTIIFSRLIFKEIIFQYALPLVFTLLLSLPCRSNRIDLHFRKI